MENRLNFAFSGSAGRSFEAGQAVHGSWGDPPRTLQFMGCRFQPSLLSSVGQQMNKALDL